MLRDVPQISPGEFKLLIVDDNENNRFTLVQRLGRLGYKSTQEAENGAQAMEMLRGGDFDLVLCDIMMPEMSGYEVLEAMRGDPKLWAIPVIMISALDELDSVARCIELGAEDYLAKPFNPTLLRARIGASLEKRRLRAWEQSVREHQDPVTGLPNRKMFLKLLSEELKFHHDMGRRLTVLRFNVDQMKALIETLGRDAGDALARIYSNRLRDRVPRPAIIASFGGPEFAVMAPNCVGDEALGQLVDTLRDLLRAPATIEGAEVIGTASIGIATNETGSETAEEILRSADLALGRAEEAGGDRFHLSDATIHEKLLNRFQLEADLRRCVEREELEMFYQPIFCLRRGVITGFESLMRWRHGARGLVSPGEFIPVAEDTGIITGMGRFALAATARQVAAWRDQFPQLNLTVNVNVSARQFVESDLVAEVDAVLTATGLAARNLKLEITEGVIINDPGAVQQVLDTLRDRAVACALDDFGTGFSSLSYLHRFPFTTLKIDRSFVTNIHERPRTAEITSAIIALAHNLDMDVVAEGIETDEELQALKAMGADFGQGYFLGRPVEAAQATEMLGTRPAA